MSAATRKDLDAHRCSKPGCNCGDEVRGLNPACHLSAGVKARYRRADGTVELRCNACGKHVVLLQVAP